MSQPKVFVTRVIPDAGLDLLHPHVELDIWPDELPPDYETLRARSATVDGLLCLLSDRIDAALIEGSPRLKVISTMAVGFDNIDIQAATARGIPVGHTPGALTEATADFAFALLMAAARRVTEAERYVRAGRWKTWGPMLLMGQDVYGATLGIIGLGRIGQAVARRARGFDMRVIYFGGSDEGAARAIGAERRSFEDVLAESDFLSLHCPLTPETRGLINADALRRMKPTSILINTARGAVVDHAALYQALRDGWIAGAALDVTDPEPIPLDSPLLALDNCIIAPHIASSTERTRARIARMAAENLLAGLRGERLPYCANPAVYGR